MNARFLNRRVFFAVTVAGLLLCPARAVAAGRVLSVRVTFYCPRCDPSHKTKTGRAFRLPGVAVDPACIPLGSRVYVPGYGWRIADDTGRKIRGRHIDVRLAARGHCDRLGVRRLRVRVQVAPKKPKGTRTNGRPR